MSLHLVVRDVFRAAVAALLLAGCSEPRDAATLASRADSQVQLRALVSAGDPDAIAELGRHYMSGAFGYPVDAAKARQMFELAAQKGSGSGLHYLGLLTYADGSSPPDVKEACGLFRLAAERDHPAGLREYGNCRLLGIGGGSPDAQAAAALFRKSIEHGGAKAYESLAELYAAGQGVPKDAAQAARLREQARSMHAGR